MTSTGTQNPSLTYMALTARAVDYAVAEMKKATSKFIELYHDSGCIFS
ncbi:hypothetical protein KUH03_18155 [Sphingobacterium sp. E70]|nr:hypothetical protein [Sphingobacterium sp. E70]ULT28334.1 hypothetical protein KUH03_18155 [Sphingobacterium sp. E70]